MKNAPLLGVSLLLAGLAGSPASAQCPQPDGLLGPCCAPAIANLPNFPPTSIPGLGLCWNQCAPTQQPTVKVALGAPASVNCGVYMAQLTVTNAAGAPVLAGALRMDYTRTWQEIVPIAPGGNLQVWRFVVKGDLGNAIAAGAACPTPSCITAANPTAFFYGYADYAFDCLTGQWQNSLVLYHGCDRFSHGPV
ncbi:MAG: hypothetical protein EPO68_15590, partial [Planctomycetota bacterium]